MAHGPLTRTAVYFIFFKLFFVLVSCNSELLLGSSITGYLGGGGIDTFKSQFVAVNFKQRRCSAADCGALLFSVCSALMAG